MPCGEPDIRRRFVVDTSVVVKWYLPEGAEPRQREAASALDLLVTGQIELDAPTLVHYELGNVLARRLGRSEESYANFLALPVTIHALQSAVLLRAMTLAKERRILFYDASYLALAEALDVQLLTDDRKLITAGRGRAKPIGEFN